MIAVVIVVLMTHNLALGVFVGILLSALFIINQLESSVKVISTLHNHQRRYQVSGQIFFSSSERFFQFFNFDEHIQSVEIDLSHAHIWDITSVIMLNSVVEKFEAIGIKTQLLGLNEASATLIDRINN